MKNKGQSLPLEFVIIIVIGIALITGTITIFDSINQNYRETVNEYQTQKALTQTLVASYQLKNIDEDKTTQISYNVPNREELEDQEYTIGSTDQEIFISTTNFENTKNRPQLAQMMDGSASTQTITLTKLQNEIIISEN